MITIGESMNIILIVKNKLGSLTAHATLTGCKTLKITLVLSFLPYLTFLCNISLVNK